MNGKLNMWGFRRGLIGGVDSAGTGGGGSRRSINLNYDRMVRVTRPAGRRDG